MTRNKTFKHTTDERLHLIKAVAKINASDVFSEDLSDAVIAEKEYVTELEARIERLSNGLMTHEGVNAFWKVWKKVGQPHKHGVFESTWMAFRAAIETTGKVQLAAVRERDELQARIEAVETALHEYTNSDIAVGEPGKSIEIGQLQVVDSVLAALKEK